ncbi:MAG: pseudouridine synthase [Pirellulaceae bacterium]
MAIRRDHPQSRDAETRYDVVERFDGITSVKLQPKTGRTHQIRVHLDHQRTGTLRSAVRRPCAHHAW